MYPKKLELPGGSVQYMQKMIELLLALLAINASYR